MLLTAAVVLRVCYLECDAQMVDQLCWCRCHQLACACRLHSAGADLHRRTIPSILSQKCYPTRSAHMFSYFMICLHMLTKSATVLFRNHVSFHAHRLRNASSNPVFSGAGPARSAGLIPVFCLYCCFLSAPAAVHVLGLGLQW